MAKDQPVCRPSTTGPNSAQTTTWSAACSISLQRGVLVFRPSRLSRQCSLDLGPPATSFPGRPKTERQRRQRQREAKQLSFSNSEQREREQFSDHVFQGYVRANLLLSRNRCCKAMGGFFGGKRTTEAFYSGSFFLSSCGVVWPPKNLPWSRIFPLLWSG